MMRWHDRRPRDAPRRPSVTRSIFTDLETVRRRLFARDRLAVLVDFDGTLAPIADRHFAPAHDGQRGLTTDWAERWAGALGGYRLELPR